jgi:hypothetical protein
MAFTRRKGPRHCSCQVRARWPERGVGQAGQEEDHARYLQPSHSDDCVHLPPRQHHRAGSGFFRAHNCPDHLPKEHSRVAATTHRTSLHCRRFLHGPNSIHQLAHRPTHNLVHLQRSPDDGRIHHGKSISHKPNTTRKLILLQFLASHNPQVRYGATFIIASGAFSFGALCNAHASANVVSDTARASAIGTVVMFGNVGGLISTWSFLPFDGPNYKIGNSLNLATSSCVLISSIFLLLWMNRNNKKRESVDVDQELAGKSTGEIEDLDWRHPSFRWRP